MSTRRGRPFRGRGGARRRTTWATINAPVAVTASGFTTLDLLGNFKADGGVQQAVTVARTHLRIIPQAAGTTGNSYGVGLIRGQNTDVGANIAGAPNPANDPYEDWLLWDQVQVDPGAHLNEFGSDQLAYDIKSMRRLEELQMSYNLVLQANQATAVTFNVYGRVLLMLP
jgi:hypothetical protein